VASRCSAQFGCLEPLAASRIAGPAEGAKEQVPSRCFPRHRMPSAQKIMSSKYAHTSSLSYCLHGVLLKGTGIKLIYLRVAEAIQIRLLLPFGLRRDLAKQSRAQGILLCNLAGRPGFV
jgi:hypothetical protein